MDGESRRRIALLYERSLKRWGPTAQAVRWANEASQNARFDVLSGLGDWEGAEVADVGCGLGDFYGYLRRRGLAVRYTGYDVTPAMVEAARQKYPDAEARFELRDISQEGLFGRFDYVVASGTFNIRVHDHEAVFRRALELMYEGCRRGMGLNVLRPVPVPEDRSEILAWCADFYFSIEPAELLACCRRLSARVELRQDYSEGESTVLVWRG